MGKDCGCRGCFHTFAEEPEIMRDIEEYQEISDLAETKYIEKIEKYGQLDLFNRDFYGETEEELIDGINYLKFEIMKLRRIKEGSKC